MIRLLLLVMPLNAMQDKINDDIDTDFYTKPISLKFRGNDEAESKNICDEHAVLNADELHNKVHLQAYLSKISTGKLTNEQIQFLQETEEGIKLMYNLQNVEKSELESLTKLITPSYAVRVNDSGKQSLPNMLAENFVGKSFVTKPIDGHNSVGVRVFTFNQSKNGYYISKPSIEEDENIYSVFCEAKDIGCIWNSIVESFKQTKSKDMLYQASNMKKQEDAFIIEDFFTLGKDAPKYLAEIKVNLVEKKIATISFKDFLNSPQGLIYRYDNANKLHLNDQAREYMTKEGIDHSTFANDFQMLYKAAEEIVRQLKNQYGGRVDFLVGKTSEGKLIYKVNEVTNYGAGPRVLYPNFVMNVDQHESIYKEVFLYFRNEIAQYNNAAKIETHGSTVEEATSRQLMQLRNMKFQNYLNLGILANPSAMEFLEIECLVPFTFVGTLKRNHPYLTTKCDELKLPMMKMIKNLGEPAEHVYNMGLNQLNPQEKIMAQMGIENVEQLHQMFKMSMMFGPNHDSSDEDSYY